MQKVKCKNYFFFINFIGENYFDLPFRCSIFFVLQAPPGEGGNCPGGGFGYGPRAEEFPFR